MLTRTLIAAAFVGLAAACGGSSGGPRLDGGAGGGQAGGSAGQPGGRGGSAGGGGTGNACGCTTGCCRSDSSCGVIVGNSLGPCVKIVTGTPDDNCPVWVGGEITLGGCCLSNGMCGLTIGGTSCFAGSEVGLPPQACP